MKSVIFPVVILSCAMSVGCGKLTRPAAEWTKVRKLAGKEQGLSHISGLVVDDKFAYVTIGGTIADQNEGTSGLRKVALDSGAVTSLDNGVNIPQSDYGGIAIDEKYIYWNAGGRILRISKDGGPPDTIASEHVGIGVDLVVDNEKLYWTNHGYYSAHTEAGASPIYVISKHGGQTDIFADRQNIPHSLVMDEKFVYWLTNTSILKQAKAGGQSQVIYQATDKELLDELAQDPENLYFGFLGAGKSRWALHKLSKQGGDTQTLVNTYSLKPIVVDESNIYFFNEKGISRDVFCRVSKEGGEVADLDTGYAGGLITQSKTLVYFASLDDIYSFSK